jgi:hypothetical protein
VARTAAKAAPVLGIPRVEVPEVDATGSSAVREKRLQRVMKVRIIRDLVNHLTDAEVTQEFMKAVDLRQRAYRELRSDVLLLDQYDLVSDHILLYSERDGRLMAYIRSIPEGTCRKYRQELPIEQLAKRDPASDWGFRRFRQEAKDVVQIFYLCLDPLYRAELKGVKAVELFVWLVMTVSEVSRDRISFAFTINNRYRQDAVLQTVGDWVPNVPDIDHPVIPDKHRFVFIPKVREGYWEETRQRFAAIYTSLSDGERDLLAQPSPSRKAA